MGKLFTGGGPSPADKRKEEEEAEAKREEEALERLNQQRRTTQRASFLSGRAVSPQGSILG